MTLPTQKCLTGLGHSWGLGHSQEAGLAASAVATTGGGQLPAPWGHRDPPRPARDSPLCPGPLAPCPRVKRQKPLFCVDGKALGPTPAFLLEAT